jgi:hypothetical protein
MRNKAEVERFVASWVVQNVRGTPGLASLPVDVDRLAANLTGDARAEGISGADINRVFGDIDDYLTEQCRQTADTPQ